MSSKCSSNSKCRSRPSKRAEARVGRVERFPCAEEGEGTGSPAPAAVTQGACAPQNHCAVTLLLGPRAWNPPDTGAKSPGFRKGKPGLKLLRAEISSAEPAREWPEWRGQEPHRRGLRQPCSP